MGKKMFRVFCFISVLLSLVLVSAGHVAAQASVNSCPQLMYYDLPIIVDGNKIDWATVDVFDSLYRAGDPGKPVEADLRLVYNCKTGTMYLIVLSENEMPVEQDLEEAWVKVDFNPNEVVFSSFAWVMNGSSAIGWEASFQLSEGKHSLKVHTNVWDDGEWQTAATYEVCVYIYCRPTSVTLANFSALPGRGGIMVSWETGSEINTMGFNLYRGTTGAGWDVRLNTELIPNQSLGGMVGAKYDYFDIVPPGTTCYYWLEDVDSHGLSEVHGPVSGKWSMPTVGGVTPSSGGKVYSQFQLFTATYSDIDGDLEKVYLKISDTDSASGVVVQYTRSTKAFTISGQGILGTKKAVLSADGKTLIIKVQLKFKKSFRDQHNIYLKAEDMPGNATGWTWSGTWKVK